jgi:8-oxo-dGTP pyrophosphatase MutT (NUDIX family)
MGSKSRSKPAVRKQRQQVAAVCYRVREQIIEFLLVQTRGGRWIFPKGGVEPGLSYAQSAALEAIEEAGVHGRIENLAFARYFRSGPPMEYADSNEPGLSVAVHLCEVSRLERPQEANRKPTWFPADKAKRCLTKGRTPAFGAELARIVDRASSRIRRLHSARSASSHHIDGLRKIPFEAFEDSRIHGNLRAATISRYLLRAPLRLSAGNVTMSNFEGKVTSIESGHTNKLQRAGASARRRS